MLGHFEIPEIFESNENVEPLEDGIYLERIGAHHHIDTDEAAETVVFGEIGPDLVWWKECMDDAVKEGIIESNGQVSWYALGQYFTDHGFEPEYADGVSLETLLEMLDEGDRVICALNDFVLEIPQAAALPSVFPNQFVWVSGVDLSEPGMETVSIVMPLWNGKAESAAKQWPLGNFLKAWMSGNNRAMSIAMEVGNETEKD